MAASTSAAASTSTAADSNNSTCYDVFISHRGPDLKKTFASHLYRRLISCGLRVFLDYKELEEGEDFPSQIKGDISAASLHVAIFSPTYADSQWCLDELVLMLESGTPIIPVFHHVKPTELRRTDGEGVYAESLRNLEKKKRKSDSQPRYDSETIENWRNALSRVANITGLDLEAFNGDEGDLVEEIVEVVIRKGVKTPLTVARYPTGLAQKVQDFETKVLLQQCSGRVQILGITGLGGVGKTTLALELFNRKRSNYRNSYFLSDVRENAKTSLHSLQTQLLKGLLQLELHIENRHAGFEKLKKHLSSCKVLLVLDDIDHQDQVFALLPLDVLHHDSLILITSRDKDVLARSGVQESSIYQLSGLNTQHSRELFCSHAFGNPSPLPEFEYLVDNFLNACNGLPLSLKVFGGLLAGNTDKSYWEIELEELRKTLPDEIQKSLQISYDALKREEQQIFLDIACFFIGKHRDTAIRVWDGSGWNGKRGLQSLTNKCLVEVYMAHYYEYGVIRQHLTIGMHDHLRDMGRDLAKRSGFPCYLWCGTKHMEDLLQQSSSEATRVRGITTSRREFSDEWTYIEELEYKLACSDKDYERYEMKNLQILIDRYKMKNLQILDIENDDDADILKCLSDGVDSPNLLYLRWHYCSCSSLPPYIPMKKLRVLDVEGYKLETLWKEDLQAPLELRELRISTHGLFKIPKSIEQLKHLERMMVDTHWPYTHWPSGMQQEICYPRSLKHLVLRHVSISSLTDSFGNLSRLEHIDFSGCSALERLPDSFGNLSRLEHIDFSGCSALERLPDSFGNLSRLEHIDLSECSALERLPDSFWNLSKLERIFLFGCSALALERLPDSIGNLSRLERIDLSGCSALESLPDSFGNLSRLKRIDLCGCSALERLPDSFGNLSRLEHIDLSECSDLDLLGCSALKRLPDSFGNLSSLKRIDLSECSALERLPDSFGNLSRLERIDFSRCRALERLPDSFGNLSRLEYIDFSACSALEGLPDSFGNLSRLECILLFGCSAERLPDSFGNLSRLEHIDLSGCSALERLPDSFGNLSRLEHINLSGCSALERLPDSFGNLSRLEHINFFGCSALERLPDSFGNLIKLEYLDLRYCDKLTIPGGTFREINPKYMLFPGWRIEVFPRQIAHQWSLEKLLLCLINLTEWPSATGEACHLEGLVLETPFLEALPPSFGNDLRTLKCLELRSCRSLKRLPDSFLLLNQLVDLRVEDCSPELDFKAVEGENETSTDSGGERTSSNLKRFLPRLQHLTLRNTHISEVSFPTCVCPDLQYLDIGNCPDLVEVTLPNALRSLNLYKCSKLGKIEAPFPTGACHNLQDLHIMKCKDLVEGTLPNAPKELPHFQQCEDLREVKTMQYAHTLIISNFSKLRKIGGSFPTGLCPKFQHLSIQHCENLVELEILPTAIQHLSIQHCENLVELEILLPDSLGNLSMLERLNLHWNLSMLERINLYECHALERLPDSFGNLSRLKDIDFHYCSSLERLPDSFGDLYRLEHINLSHCFRLMRLPDSFGDLSRLEHINLSHCFRLMRLPDSLGNLSRLEHINLSRCFSLKRLPDSFGDLSRLEHIDLSECSALERLPDSFGDLSRLEHINLSHCFRLMRLPDSFGNLSMLERIQLYECHALERLPNSFGNLSRLKNIDLNYCISLERLPDSFGNLCRLEHINLSHCFRLMRLPDSFGDLSRLEHINLSHCFRLMRLPDSLGNLSRLEHINLSRCFSLKRLPDSFGDLSRLEHIDLSECSALERLPDSFGNDLRNLKCLELRSCRSLKRLPDSFLRLNQLIDLRVEDCSPELDFKAVEGENETSTDSGGERTSSNLERFLPRLQHLTLRNTHISEVSFPTCVCPDLQYLDISNCPDLVEVTLPNALRSLNLYKCSKLRKIGAPFPTGACANLQDLHIMKCNDLMPNASFHNASFKDPACVMTSRHGLAIKVEISNFSKLTKIGGSFPTGVCPNFQDLSIQHCENLVELEILPTAIQHLKIRKCENLVELEILPTVIQHLKIRKCEELVEVDCPNLQPLEIWPVDCQELVEVGTLPNALLKMQLINCPKMREIEQLCGFTKLRTLEVSRRKEVEKLPSIECNTETLRESRGQRALSNSDSLFDKCLLRLQHLELHKLQISQVSFPTGACPNLQHLHIRDCEDLIEVRTLPNALIKLQLDRCPKLKLIRIEELAQVMQLREMRVRFCDGLEEMVGVGYLKSLEVMQVTDCMQLKIIQGLEQLTQLRELDFSYCFELEELLGVGHLKSLEVFKATMCQRLKSIRGLEQLTLLRLRELDISYCSELETLS